MTKISCVLLVEDDPITVFVTLKAIKSLNIIQEIKVCKSADVAIEFLYQKLDNNEPAPELIFLDINMPGKDGYDFFEIFKKMNFSNIEKVITCVLTTSSHINDIERTKKLGVQEYFNKPITKETVQMVYNKYFL